MRTLFTPALLIPLVLCLAACGQSGDLYRRDENAKGPPVNPNSPAASAALEAGPATATPDEDKDEDAKKKAAENGQGAQPAATPAGDSAVPSTSKPSAGTP